jgi:hypothetical protein
LRARLEKAAAETGRSLNAEMAARLEMSFDAEGRHELAEVFLKDPRTAVVLLNIHMAAMVLQMQQQFLGLPGSGGKGKHWRDDPVAGEQMAEIAYCVVRHYADLPDRKPGETVTLSPNAIRLADIVVNTPAP